MKQIKVFAVAVAVSAWLTSCENHNNPNFWVGDIATHNEHHDAHGEHDAHGTSDEKATGSFGAKIDEQGAIAAADVIKALETKDSVVGKITAPITAVCQKKGCWMSIDANGTEMRVTFKDYGFFVPKNASGHTAIMQGVARKEVISVATLKHYAEDAGQSKEEIAKITKPETEYSFEATGVIIK